MEKSVEEWKVFDRRAIARGLFSWARMGQFIMRRAPQVFVIWAAVALLLKASFFTDAFGWFAGQASSPFYRVDDLSTNQPVDLTPVFLIGVAGIVVAVAFALTLYVCIKLSHLFGMPHPAKLEGWAAHFTGRLTDEVSSILTHCSAATLVLLIGGRPAMYGSTVVFSCVALCVFAFVFGGICYREA